MDLTTIDLTSANQIPNDLKFNAELDFVNQLAYDEYVVYLLEHGFFEQEAFIRYVRYLNYFARPEYARFLRNARSVFYLERLTDETFRRNLAVQITIGEGSVAEEHTYCNFLDYCQQQSQVSQNYFEAKERAVEQGE
ncbi:SOH1 family protein [Spironucleus salmonicida]|uniref:Mediator of RNA polymerase II transcription subunit 31 n=1 Tax=Spironucleus salmonicida TaxID=348837 RepID=V6LVF8_9EUKA|nr:SOH1 family protein [Spironucleus salmonicida]|eukprot:EST44789.1 SOH1 family protein [Spironucleus salmonicida]